MPARAMLAALLLLAPGAASARDIATCAALYKQLNNTRQVIGNTAERRRYAQELSLLGSQIRTLRIEMRRTHCAGGSIVVIGGNRAADCKDKEDQLRALEAERQRITTERDEARLKPPSEREALLVSIRENACIPSDLEAVERERRKLQGIALPKEDAYSAITDLRTTPVEAVSAAETVNLPSPERPYDPSKKVRMVGPIFLPEQQIDLANPRLGGPQPLQ
ncbi:hypothetical protein M0654_20625 [Rhizobium sp. NTR19]|uniref:Uncharacterized protein n=1 Tax=Neorhizobium turbinariae TaxID=2937795 RepID=A0ABT0IXC5_9HYPH|nr:hypothetical protein [Neorhizobium turbinariae]MCK8782386.1 hypothetical protein [Neorhizobium turbinariae]